VAEFVKGHHLKEALTHKVSKQGDAHIENLELSPKLKVSKISNLQAKSLSDYDKLDDQGKIVFLAGVFDGEGSFGIWSKWKRQKYLACSVETSDRDMVLVVVCIYAKKDKHIIKILGDGGSMGWGLCNL